MRVVRLYFRDGKVQVEREIFFVQCAVKQYFVPVQHIAVRILRKVSEFQPAEGAHFFRKEIAASGGAACPYPNLAG